MKKPSLSEVKESIRILTVFFFVIFYTASWSVGIVLAETLSERLLHAFTFGIFSLIVNLTDLHDIFFLG